MNSVTRETVEELYRERISFYHQKVTRLQKTENRLVIFRLSAFLAGVGLFLLFIGTSLFLSFMLLLASWVLLGVLIKYNLSISNMRQHFQFLCEINDKEIQCIHGNFSSFPDGTDFINKDHPYSADLDIFGKASLFQYLNRATSKPGNQMLALWLSNPADGLEILRRQQANEELIHKLDWRQRLLAVGYHHAESDADPAAILHWVHQDPEFSNRKYLKPILNCLSLAIIASIGFVFFHVSSLWITMIILINLLVAGFYTKKINQIHRDVTKTVNWLMAYANTIQIIEKEQFSSPKLSELQQIFINQQFGASKQLKTLSDLVNMLDYRLNLVVGFLLNIICFWDIRLSMRLEQWKERNKLYLDKWFSAMAEFEALVSIATAGYNNPDWCFPLILPQHFTLRATGMGHPLIPVNRRITNDFEVNGSGKIMLITGSNMSGKSTFLRTCGINMVLVMTGAPVCAASFEMSPVTVFSSMRINDSLEENTSSFYAELKRLASIIKRVENNDKIFLLLDEILRGTNSNDRHIGSMALIRQLIVNHAVGIIATHDLELSGLTNEFTQNIENYHFDVKIENDELYFDYHLNRGICKSLNASILMKKMGIHV